MKSYLEKMLKIMQTTREIAFFIAFAVLFLGGDKMVGFMIVFITLASMVPVAIATLKDKKFLEKHGVIERR